VSIGGLLKEIKKEVFGSSVNGSNGSRDVGQACSEEKEVNRFGSFEKNDYLCSH
jgi:hypothetical protein